MLIGLILAFSRAAGSGRALAKVDPAVLYRTDSANAQLPWYRLQPGVLPLRGSEHRVAGELTEADFIHRAGQFRTEGSGELVDFTMTPYGVVNYLNTEADLRDVPLGTRCVFSLHQDEKGAFTRLALLEAGIDALPSATEELRKHHNAFLKERGLPALIERVEGKKVTLTVFGEPAALATLCKEEGIDPAAFAAEHRRIGVAVANEELRTYNPPVDQQRSMVLEYSSAPTDRFGAGGIRWVIQPNLLLEGFRKGHIVRLFKEGWPIKDMPYGESVYPEVFNSETVETDPLHYPFRTDFANPDLPWYQLQPGRFPPIHSDHRVSGELLKVNPSHRSGQFRADRSGELIAFTMPPFGSVMYRAAEADLADVPLGTHCYFSLHPDETGAFTKASLIVDDFTELVTYRVTYRLKAAPPDNGLLLVARQLPPMKDERDATIQPPDLGQMQLAVDSTTRIWKEEQQVPVKELMAGDQLVFNRTGATTTDRGHCTDIWVSTETHKLARENQLAKHNSFLKEHGMPAWIDSIEGGKLTITFFSGNRKDFASLIGSDPHGQNVYVRLADSELNPTGARIDKMAFRAHLPEAATAGTYGCSGVRWLLEANPLPEEYAPGRVIRLFKQDWPFPDHPGQ